ncbi:receptor-type tyrosine-protein phosphatase eta isoform X3 [Gallus gallus]|uniref:Receptor-type tyrosine-protein phosphatase eta n=1 Tax=Gallus gallus TaxID=9031 RepID=A0A8V0ZQ39_CHICK|nr:receptor-type tyrosine-protein phosphatase eta isoform X3 [Gallus gallus]
MRRLPLLPPCPLLLLLLLPAEVRCTTACTDDCSLKNVTEEMGTSSNDELSVNATSGNRRLSEDVSLPGRAMSDQNSVAQPRAVLDLKTEYVGVTSVNLTWTVNDTDSASYTYRIEVRNGSSINNKTSDITDAEITGLIPGTLYTFTVFAVAADGQTAGEGASISLYTKPSPVLDLKAEYVGVTSVNLTWTVNDTASASYTYRIEVTSDSSIDSLTSSVTMAEITGLIPGTLYSFKVFAVAADNRTEADGASISLYTKPSPVLDLKAEYVGVTSVNLTWTVNGTALTAYTYRIEVRNATSIRNETSNINKIEITGLIPGTSYNFKVFATPVNNTTEEEGLSLNLYTKPSPVLRVVTEYVGVTSVNLTWMVDDTASDSYTYRIEVRNGSSINNKTSDITDAEITGLIPGTLYTFTVFAVAADGQTAGEGASISLYTKPSPVLDLKAEYVGVTSVNLTWTVNDTASASYTYRIEVTSDSSIDSLTSNVTMAEITGLIPGTLYNFTVFAVAADNRTEADGAFTSLYTKPTPVTDLKAEHGVTSVSLNWMVNDTASDSYTYRIEVRNGHSVNNKTSNIPETEITGLNPGTLYTFTVFAVAADGETEGEGASISVYTKPRAVLHLKTEYVGVTSVNLTWTVNDTDSASYTYRIEVRNGSSINNKTSDITDAEITGLDPGTLYIFTVFAVAADGQTAGEGASISLYTKPSMVLNLKAEYVTMTSVNLTWMVNDAESASYTYRIEVAHESLINETMSNVTKSIVTYLIPGTSYNFTVFAIAADNQTEGEGASISQNTVPSSVNAFQCEAVANMSYLTLKWNCPYGGYSGFDIEIFNGTWTKKQQSQFCGREGSEEIFKTEPLDYYKTYTVSVTTVSDGLTSLPVQKICKTSITDPPVPNKAPLVKAVSHNSLSVEFPDFESVNGPLKAYAVMIVTEAEGCLPSKSDLDYTYNDFKQKMTATYVTYVIDVEEISSSSHSQNGHNIVDVGKGNTMYGYENGPLIPLHSYRASVAGFTNINFTVANKIMGEQSYVSFSPCSEVVSLPQDPGVIAGAVIGCLLAILAVVAIGGYIFWRRRRKDKRNTEVSFSPIKSKMIKVENFESYFKKQQADSNCGFAEEYEELKSAGVHQPKFAAEIAENRGKNRYNNVLPYDISRVKLSNPSCTTDDYINANYMPGYSSKKAFIAAQGPLPNTIEDFWRMIWEKNIYSIVMLTKCVEQARTKCEQYWPDKQSKSYGDIIVTMVSEVVLPEWTIRDFNVENADTMESHTVRQFHFTSWPDHGVPETTDLLINFRHLVHEYSSQNPIDSPILVHCSAGVGRTGTFIAIDRLIQQIEMENTVDVYGVVYDLRMHRPLMVQTEDQYVFLNQCVMDIIRSQKEKKTDLIYQNTTAMAIYENFTPGPAFGKANGYHA